MSNAMKIVAACAGAAGIATGAAFFVPATASAASYGNQCGAGYNVIDTHELKGGTIFLTYNGEKNCVVTVRDQPGAPVRMAAGVELSEGKKNVAIDEGQFTEYAGPVYVSAKGRCIDWAGIIGDDKWEIFDVHCQ
ncbi:spore-associated protein A [Nocardia nepalensis]|uniref:spore-associated protein A n=1 Tax=Nocardia nepalensis TaxID=3375448 RepID=UPI003B680DBA